MCGIAGYVDFERGGPDRAVLMGMAHALRHRGPDAQGVWADGPCGLAHARLSIIDVAGSHQPFAPDDSAFAVAFNGEIYNYEVLRSAQRARGIQHETRGDTEALLRQVESDWVEAMPALDGMFAFAVWDRRGERLLLARDPLGKKPLFYACPRPGLLIFASEIKAILHHPEMAAELDLGALAQTLRFRAVYGDGTLYRGIRQVEPGGCLEFDRNGVHPSLHYRLLDETASRDDRPASEASLIEEGRSLLVAAVRKRLIADVPVGAFLSGGLDSSLIVALIRSARAPSETTHTFSVGFEGDARSELPHARVVADALGTCHTEVVVRADDYASLLTQATLLRDAPVSEPADVAIYVMSREAKRTVKVVLSGEGSDEVFCGYPKYRFAAAPAALRRLLRAVGPQRVARAAAALGIDARRSRVAARALGGATELDRLVQWFSYFERDELQALLPGLDWSAAAWQRSMEAQASVLAECASRDPLVRMQAVDCLTWLPSNLLERGDRMTMGAGLEGRFPFLDPTIVSFGFHLPARMKVRGRSLKWVVRRWAEGSIPEQILRRPKWGFRVPLADWFRSGLRPLVEDTLRDPDGLCGRYGDVRAVERLLEEHAAGRVDRSLELWTLLTVALWYRSVFLDRDGGRSA